MKRKRRTKAPAKRNAATTGLALANESYGELKAHLHIAGYTFERGCQRLKQLLTGNDWQRCGGGFNKIDDFLNSLGLDQFAKVTEDRRDIKKLIQGLRPDVSTRAIARALKVDESTLRETPARAAKRASKNRERLREFPAPRMTGAESRKTAARAERVKEHQITVDERVTRVALDAHKLGLYSLLLADPPWEDEFGANQRSTENHYPTMSAENILALPVREIAHEQAMLFLWATSPMLEIALETVKAWGFEYRTQFVWVKPSIGLGKYVRQRHELLLICRRGDHPAPDARALSDSVIEASRSEHSAKPEVFFEIIERMYPAAQKIELFRRGLPRGGWAAWGAEAKTELVQAAE